MSKTIDDLAREQGVTPMGDADDVARRIVGTVPDTIEDVRREIVRLEILWYVEAGNGAEIVLCNAVGPLVVGTATELVTRLGALAVDADLETIWAAVKDLPAPPVGEDARRVRTLFALTDSRPKESEW